MRVLGIDVGFAITGWSIVEKNGSKLEIISYGIIETKDIKEPMESRIYQIFLGVKNIIEKFNPEDIAIESIFFFKNQKTVINVAQVRGAIVALSKMYNLNIFNYTPLQVKIAVTGYGRADKKQVQRSLKIILGIQHDLTQDDSADAIAISICHINSKKVSYNKV